MFDLIWKTISHYFYVIVAIPCMSIFPFRFQKKYKVFYICMGVLVACTMKYVTENSLHYFLFGTVWWPNYLWDQLIHIIDIILICSILYKGKIVPMLLTVFLSMSLSAQVGCIVGGLMSIYRDVYTIAMLVWRDILGYSAYSLFYFILWKYLHITEFNLSSRDSIILLFVSLINFLLTSCFTRIFPLGQPSSIPFYIACLFTTLSIVFVIFLFTRDHLKVQEQQLMIQEIKLSENTYTQMQETAAQMREIKHELSNYFIYAQQLLEAGDYEMLKEHISTIIKTNIPLTEAVSTNNAVVNSIVNQKNAYAKSLNICTDFHVVLPDILPIDNLTFCTIFGNLLNNAIEACKMQENAFIRLDVHPVKNYLSFRVDNSVPCDVLKENPHLHTTKEDAANHGNGIQILKKIVEKYDGMMHYEMSSPNCFSIQLMLKM